MLFIHLLTMRGQTGHEVLNGNDNPMNDNNYEIDEKLGEIYHRMEAAALRGGYDPQKCTLMAVTKSFERAVISEVLAAGHSLFGENRVQEAISKWPALKEKYQACEVHLIGPLQTNKARQAVDMFDGIQTLDREKLARVLADIQEEGAILPRLFVQVNTGEEPQKSGVEPRKADEFIETCRRRYGLTIAGLMCVPPVNEEPALHFALLKKIANRNGITELSMGMSHDFETAVEMGATIIRVGSAIFGFRSGYE